MLLFDKGYAHIKQEYITPLSQQHVNYRSLNYKNIKTVLCEGKFTSVECVSKNRYSLTFDEDIIIPALLGDMWLCYIRSCLQRDATQKTYPLYPNFCPNWSIVSDYYYAFYSACTLLRLTMRGNIYFDSAVQKKINMNISTVLGDAHAVSENSTYVIQKDHTRSGIYIMDLKPSNHQTHETVWHEVAAVIGEIRANASARSEERVALDCLDTVLHVLDNNFPSKLRNAVNYQLPYGIKAIERKIYPAQACQLCNKWFDPILSFEAKKKCDDFKRVQLFKAYTKYLDILVNNLIAEYNDLHGRKSGIESAINKHRSIPIEFPDATYTYQ